MDTSRYDGKYKVYNFKWGYIMATFPTLKQAKAWVSSKGMLCDHRKGETNLYAAL